MSRESLHRRRAVFAAIAAPGLALAIALGTGAASGQDARTAGAPSGCEESHREPHGAHADDAGHRHGEERPHNHVDCAAVPNNVHGSDFNAYGGSQSADDRAPRTAAAAVKGGASSGRTLGRTTLEQTITGGDRDERFQFLKKGPGEPRIVREDLAEAKPGRGDRRRSLLYAAQTTDWQLADEESPSRVEFFDITANEPFPNSFSAAHRPQEAFNPFAVETSIQQLNRFTDASPHRQGNGKRAAMDFTILTGDQADNQQLNETRWVVRLLEGGRLDPNSGTDPSSCPPGQRPQGQTADPRKYAGVQDYDDYLAQGFQFYDPEQPAGIWSDWPRYPNLMDRAQKRFRASGLDVPSYVTPGNHDGLAQGNQKAIRPFEDVGTGCVKPIVPVTSLTNPDDFEKSLTEVLDPDFLADPLTSNPGQATFVPPDERRRYVDKAEYKALFDTGAQEDAHGFGFVDKDELKASGRAASYYAWNATPAIRMVSIDTLCEGGVAGPASNGNIDDPQFQWLRGELRRAQQRDKLIIVFGHHPIRNLSCNLQDELPAPAQAGSDCTVDDEHGHDINPGCDRDPRTSTPIHLGDDLEALFHKFPNVISYVAGHTHEHKLADFDRADGGPGDFWGIETASLVDSPPQNRLVELMDNCDGTLSFLATVVDTGAPIKAPSPGTDASGLDTFDLGSISRTLAYNDPQAGPELGEGERKDRNVELLLEDPRREPSKCTRTAADPDSQPPPDDDGNRGESGGGSTGFTGGGSADSVTASDANAGFYDDGSPRTSSTDGTTGTTGGSLPFTGLGLIALVLAGIALLLGGALVRRASGPQAGE